MLGNILVFVELSDRVKVHSFSDYHDSRLIE